LLVVVLVVSALVAGGVAAAVAWRLPRAVPASFGATRPTARAVERALRRDSRLGGVLRRWLDPAEATGLLLAIALVVLALGVALFGVLVYMVGEETGLASFDHGIDQWARQHAAPFSDGLLDVATALGSTVAAVGFMVAVLVVEHFRVPSRVLPVFFVVVLGGQALLVQLVKETVDRVRPDAGLANGLGPSFPSGHSATAAACFAAIALALSRRRGPRAQALVVGGAVALAILVATTRVLLGVHWFTDALAGLVLGWAWFSLCALAFGGRLLRFGAPVEAGVRTEHLHPAAPSDRPPQGRANAR